MKRILVTLIAVSLLSIAVEPAQAWFPGQGIARMVRNGAQRRQSRRAEGRGLGRFGIGTGGTHYGGGCSNGTCR